MTTFLIVLMILVSIFMVLVVLVQRGRGGGLSGAFGSGGGSNSAFGTKTGDVFTTITVVAFVVFMLLSIGLAFRFKAASGGIVPPTPAAGAPNEPTPVDVLPPTTGPEDAALTTRPGTQPAAIIAPQGPTTRPTAPATAPATRP